MTSHLEHKKKFDDIQNKLQADDGTSFINNQFKTPFANPTPNPQLAGGNSLNKEQMSNKEYLQHTSEIISNIMNVIQTQMESSLSDIQTNQQQVGLNKPMANRPNNMIHHQQANNIPHQNRKYHDQEGDYDILNMIE